MWSDDSCESRTALVVQGRGQSPRYWFVGGTRTTGLATNATTFAATELAFHNTLICVDGPFAFATASRHRMDTKADDLSLTVRLWYAIVLVKAYVFAFGENDSHAFSKYINNMRLILIINKISCQNKIPTPTAAPPCDTPGRDCIIQTGSGDFSFYRNRHSGRMWVQSVRLEILWA